MTIVILPLDHQIGHEQEAKISQIGGRPCFLNREVMNDALLDKVRSCRFSRVLLSPELAVGESFLEIAASPEFKSRVTMVSWSGTDC